MKMNCVFLWAIMLFGAGCQAAGFIPSIEPEIHHSKAVICNKTNTAIALYRQKKLLRWLSPGESFEYELLSGDSEKEVKLSAQWYKKSHLLIETHSFTMRPESFQRWDVTPSPEPEEGNRR